MRRLQGFCQKLTMRSIYKNYIGGRWIAAASGETFENRNPADQRDLIGLFPDSAAEDIDAAARAARRALSSWRLIPAPKRGEIIFKAGEILKRRKEEIARAMTREMGKNTERNARRRAGGNR